ncbi:MAG: UDP-N-acetylmuramoyl-L-alanine--D-glutamate ligase, partial [Gammaproteobacteria bacterium]
MAHKAQQAQPERVIVGLGDTGLSVARHLHRLGMPFAVVDSRLEPPGLAQLRSLEPEVPMHLGDLDTPWLQHAHQLVLSPGLSPDLPQIRAAREAGVEVIGDIELFAHAADAPVIAITGSNGKSTVTALVGEMARAAGVNAGVGGNIGTPALDLLAEDHDLLVVELSSFQLETTASLAPRASVILNISADHLDRHGTLDRYAAAKARIYERAETRIANRQDARVRALAGAEAVSFGLDRP